MHPALMKSSGWKWNRRKRELDAAHWWGGLSPGEFDDLSKDEKLDLIALYEVDWRINAINSYEANEEAIRNSKKPKRGKK